jgi:predicted HTH domain antitoxin
MVERSVVELEEVLAAVAETGLYKSRETFLMDAVNTLLAARPDIREAVACQLYKMGVFSLGRTATWSGLSIEAVKESLYHAGISREAPEDLAELEAMARRAMKVIRRSVP